MSMSQIQVIYEGEALQDGSMDVYELAPALLGLGDVFQEANRIFNGDEAKCSVRVRDSFQRGSFEITFDLISVAQQMSQLFASAPKTIDDIAFLLGLSLDSGAANNSISLIELLKLLKGRHIRESKNENTGNIILEFHGCNFNANSIEISPQVNNLRKNPKVRKSLAEVVRPIEKEGIEKVSFKKNGRVVNTIDRENQPYFSPMIEEFEEPIGQPIEETIEELIEVISPSFEPGNKWRVNNGAETFWVKLEDEIFQGKIANKQVSFTKGDLYKVKILKKKVQTLEGLKTVENSIVEVIENSNPLKLPFESQE